MSARLVLPATLVAGVAIGAALAGPPGDPADELVVFQAGKIARAGDVNANFAQLGARLAALEAVLSDDTLPLLADVLPHLSIEFTDDGTGTLRKTIRFTGVNVQIVNGLGASNGFPADPDSINPGLVQTNGLGNLIVGYDEQRLDGSDLRTGSHNVVVGPRHRHTSFGGLVAADANAIEGPYAVVVGGTGNVADGSFAAVLGGQDNEATGFFSSVGGGRENRATGDSASVLGGFDNLASGSVATVAGGSGNDANGGFSSVAGGSGNSPQALFSSVSGGRGNQAFGDFSTVGGGAVRSALGEDDWVAGSLTEDL